MPNPTNTIATMATTATPNAIFSVRLLGSGMVGPAPEGVRCGVPTRRGVGW